ncbi:type II toxin-antitoxin system HicA family toxin [Desulfonatronovibrio magnus]|uniref:type II toxin-antitoxin system HicA family toxin n=1 Tax=Desulfonatronovibrio magnus TaxID=698827 RepID=UPI0005EBD675|nr:type II toxin-antitoxin system HicA family toxin [Desulfonatronovibrio magnus]
MPKSIPSLKPKQLIKIIKKNGCEFYREGKGDHRIFIRVVQGKKHTAPIDMGAGEMSPPYVIRIFRQLGFTDVEIDKIFS